MKTTLRTMRLSDLKAVKRLEPEDWGDISSAFRFYVQSSFCRAIAVVADRRIIGVGAAIAFDGSGWLAHIIVDEPYRNQGIGTMIVDALLGHLRAAGCCTVSLIATPLGAAVYTKFGFRTVTTYRYFTGDTTLGPPHDEGLVAFEPRYERAILSLDARASGEQRAPLLRSHLPMSRIYLQGSDVGGFYLPSLGEGLIVAETTDAGTALLRQRLHYTTKTALPAENTHGAAVLTGVGCREVMTAQRMVRGVDLRWCPSMIYCRAGGNLG